MTAIALRPCIACGETTDCWCETEPCRYCAREAVCRNGFCSEECRDASSHLNDEIRRALVLDELAGTRRAEL